MGYAHSRNRYEQVVTATEASSVGTPSARESTLGPLIRAWRWLVYAANWRNGSAAAKPTQGLSRCAYDQIIQVMAK